MKTIKEVEERRERILEQMRAIRSMERGTISEHYVPVKHKGQKEPVRKGPYYVISRRGEEKTEGYHLRTPEDVERARRDVEAHKEFRKLCREFEELTEQLGRLSRGKAEEGVEKKGLKPPSRKTPR